MSQITIQGKSVDFHFDSRLKELSRLVPRTQGVLVTDQHVFDLHQASFKGWKTIVLPAGEPFKQQHTIDNLLRQLMDMQADRSTVLIGVGGGVVTDMTGYAASIYMRGIRFGFVPTTLLAMVDAAIGGKNGVDVGIYKNLVGTINQPAFLLYDSSLLQTLPQAEWQNGFAEIIKHAAIRDAAMFKLLEQHDLTYFMKHKAALADLVKRNALLKTRVVKLDPLEKGIRRQLNFGHTVGHAIENDLQLMHGQAVAIGMVYAAQLSAERLGFEDTLRLINAIEQYGLPTHAEVDADKVIRNLKLDKKREQAVMRYVLLEKLGKAVVEDIPLTVLEKWIKQWHPAADKVMPKKKGKK